MARAEDSGLDAGSVDLVTAAQCWVWFDHDRALTEVGRVLRPGGLLAVVHYCYLPRHSEVAARTEELILQHNSDWPMAGWDGIYAKHIDALQNEHLKLSEQFCYDYDQPFTHAGWRGRIRTCNGVGSGVLTDEQVAAFDRELAELLQSEFPQPTLLVQHRVWATICRRLEHAS